MQSKQTLYNKYRPLSFADVVNQNHIKITLQNEVASDKLAHAYLFNGPRGIGKTTIARILAKAVNCEDRKEGTYEPCNKCDSCQEVDMGKSLSMVEIDAASQTKVDQTRENIIAASRVSASAGRIKVFIIDEVHMLSTASFNALLKTLEEPPAKVLFILATTEVHKVPETIISRCQRFDFHRLSVVDLVQWMEGICELEKCEVSKDVLQAIAKQAEGGARDALSILGQVLTLSDKKITFEQASLVLPRSDVKIISELTDHLIDRQAGQAIDLFNRSLMEGIDLNQVTIDWIDYLRQLLLLQLSADKKILQLNFDKEVQKKMTEQVAKLSASRLIFMIDTMLNKYQQIKLSSIPHLPIELAIVMICERSENTPLHVGRNNSGDKPKLESKPESKPEAKLEAKPDEPRQQPEVKVDIPIATKVEQEEALKPPLVGNSNLNLDAVQSKWLDILMSFKEYNHSLSALMKVARPISFENGVFTIGFQYLFHSEVLEDKNKKRVSEEIFTKHMGEPIFLKVIIDENYDKRDVWEVNMQDGTEDESPEDQMMPASIEPAKPVEKDVEVDVATAFG